MNERRKKPEISIDELVERSIVRTLTAIGFDMEKAVETQQDIAFLRAQRQRCENFKAKAFEVAAKMGVTGIIGLLLAGMIVTVKQWIGK